MIRRSGGTAWTVAGGLVVLGAALLAQDRAALLDPTSPAMQRTASAAFRIRMETSKGPVVIAVHRDWAPHGVDRIYNLVRNGYYDDSRFYRAIAGKWVQFGINGDPAISTKWRRATIPDDPWRGRSNRRGTIAYAFKEHDGRTTQVFVNLRDNSATHDKEPFVVFGEVTSGMDFVDALNTEYGERSGGGIRGGHQDPLFTEGNRYLLREFPRLDYIVRATVE